jgi:glycerol kinase
MQFQADLLGVEIHRPTVIETTALGAAFLAGLGVGLWKDAASLAARRRRDRLFTPAMPPDRREALYAGWASAVGRVRSR